MQFVYKNIIIKWMNFPLTNFVRNDGKLQDWFVRISPKGSVATDPLRTYFTIKSQSSDPPASKPTRKFWFVRQLSRTRSGPRWKASRARGRDIRPCWPREVRIQWTWRIWPAESYSCRKIYLEIEQNQPWTINRNHGTSTLPRRQNGPAHSITL